MGACRRAQLGAEDSTMHVRELAGRIIAAAEHAHVAGKSAPLECFACITLRISAIPMMLLLHASLEIYESPAQNTSPFASHALISERDHQSRLR
jgi:hypothetical protein